MFHFDWGVFWAVLIALAIAYALFRSGIDPVWHERVLKKSLELQERQIELLEHMAETSDSQLKAQENIAESFPQFK